jgi:hypothetical protein
MELEGASLKASRQLLGDGEDIHSLKQHKLKRHGQGLVGEFFSHAAQRVGVELSGGHGRPLHLREHLKAQVGAGR